jgi:hypothetical protein
MDEVVLWMLWHNPTRPDPTRLHSTLADVNQRQFEKNWRTDQPRQANLSVSDGHGIPGQGQTLSPRSPCLPASVWNHCTSCHTSCRTSGRMALTKACCRSCRTPSTSRARGWGHWRRKKSIGWWRWTSFARTSGETARRAVGQGAGRAARRLKTARQKKACRNGCSAGLCLSSRDCLRPVRSRYLFTCTCMKLPSAEVFSTRILVPVLGTCTPDQPRWPIAASGATQ